MTKKTLIALADVIRTHNAEAKRVSASYAFDTQQIKTLADFCASKNPRFKKDRWLDYIAGKCGPNGGAR